MNEFCLWLEDTPLSQDIQVSDWIVPVTQIIHILAVATALFSCLLIALRLIGYFALEQSFSSVFHKYTRIFKFALLVLFLSGLVLIIGEPSRSLANISFQIKMLLLLGVFINLHFIGRYFLPPQIDWKTPLDVYAPSNLYGKVLATMLIVLLSMIVFAGRWIAYT